MHLIWYRLEGILGYSPTLQSQTMSATKSMTCGTTAINLEMMLGQMPKKHIPVLLTCRTSFYRGCLIC